MAIKFPGKFQRKFSRNTGSSFSLFGDFIRPWTPACMADVDDPRFFGFDAPIDQIWVSPDRKHTRLLDLGKAPDLWMAPDQRESLIDGSFDVSCTLPAVSVKEIEDAAQIVARTRRVADPHKPWRFQSASI